MASSSRERATEFCRRFGLDAPILLAPMAGACPPSLAVAVANAGGMGACGAVSLEPDAILDWLRDFQQGSNRSVQINLWIPDSAPRRDRDHERDVARFLAGWGPGVPEDAADAPLADFDAQCEAMLTARPPVISSIMGLYPSAFVMRMKQAGIAWFAAVSSVREAKAAEAAGADVVVAQGFEAGGHRGAFEPSLAERQAVGLMSLLPAVADAVDIPVVAAGGIADGRGMAAALTLGASAAQIGTAFLRCPEAKIDAAWADALGRTLPEDTMVSRAFSGRPGRSIATDYALAASGPEAPARRPIRYSAGSQRVCAKTPRRRAICSACRPGRDNPPRWRARKRQPRLSRGCGEKRKRCFPEACRMSRSWRRSPSPFARKVSLRSNDG